MQLLFLPVNVWLVGSGKLPLLLFIDLQSPVLQPLRQPVKSQLPICINWTAMQVITPVRRSVRTAKDRMAQESSTPAAVRPMLEAANYCYQPNAALLNRGPMQQ
jgi:hypothetical protein